MSSLTHYSELFYGYFHEMIHYSEFFYRELPRNAVAKDEKNADVYQPHNPKAYASYKIWCHLGRAFAFVQFGMGIAVKKVLITIKFTLGKTGGLRLNFLKNRTF